MGWSYRVRSSLKIGRLRKRICHSIHVNMDKNVMELWWNWSRSIIHVIRELLNFVLLHYGLQKSSHLEFCIEYFVTFCINATNINFTLVLHFAGIATFCSLTGLRLPLLRIAKNHVKRNMHLYKLYWIDCHRYQRVLTWSLSKWRQMWGSCWKLPL